MIIIAAYNPRATATGIELNVEFAEIGLVPFHATPIDPEQHGRDLYARALAGEFGEVVPYFAPPDPEPTIDQLAARKLAAIQAEKIRVRDGGVMVGEIPFDSDAGARLAYLEIGFKMMLNPNFIYPGFKASAGVWVTLDAAMLTAVQAAGEVLFDKAFGWQKTQETAVAAALAANDIAALLAVSEVYQAH